MSQTFQFTTPEGRLVGGHPMQSNVRTDPRTQQPIMGKDGQPSRQTFIAVAIPKGGETHWYQTEWGGQIYQAAVAGWPNGEYNAPTFAWKIDDGDSQVPNKNGKKPCDREGYPGHWVLKCSTSLPVACFNKGYYDPTQQIQQEGEIKPGDYCRVFLQIRGNNPSQSPGVYLNPTKFELSRAGELIVLESGPSAAEAFGGGAPAGPVAGPPVSPSVQPGAPGGPAGPGAVAQPPGGPGATASGAPAVAPARDFLNPQGMAAQPPGAPVAPPPPTAVQKYQTANGAFTREELLSYGWNEQQILSCPVVQG